MTSHALKSFWKCYERLPAHVQKLADKKAFTQSKSVAATELLLESETVITIGSG